MKSKKASATASAHHDTLYLRRTDGNHVFMPSRVVTDEQAVTYAGVHSKRTRRDVRLVLGEIELIVRDGDIVQRIERVFLASSEGAPHAD